MSAQSMLFACSKCFTRHPFEELSPGQQLCKSCRGSFPIVKCTFCRSEFQQTSKGSTSTICKKCEANVKQYGKPSACELCNIIAAFIGNKCQRCTNSELKYGPAVTCDQCKQRCAFNRQDYKVDGKLLCWLCYLSYKRALTKARQVENDRRAKKRATEQPSVNSSSASNSIKPISSSMQGNGATNTSSSTDSSRHSKKPRHQDPKQILPEIPEKVAKSANTGFVDPHSSDHVIHVTQLKENIASLQKKVNQKDAQLLQKDKEIAELKGKHWALEQELRNKYKEMEKIYEFKLDVLNKKLKQQLVEIAQLSKSGKKEIKKAPRFAIDSKEIITKTNIKKEEKDSDNNSERGKDSDQASEKDSDREESARNSPRYDSSTKNSPQYDGSTKNSPRYDDSTEPSETLKKDSQFAESPKTSPRSESPKNSPRSESPKNSPQSESPKNSPRSESPKNSPRSESPKNTEVQKVEETYASEDSDNDNDKEENENDNDKEESNSEKEDDCRNNKDDSDKDSDKDGIESGSDM